MIIFEYSIYKIILRTYLTWSWKYIKNICAEKQLPNQCGNFLVDTKVSARNQSKLF